MTLKSISYTDNLESLSNIWDQTINNINYNNVFLTYQWLVCWLNTYAKNDKQFIIYIKEEESIIAIAPLIIVSHYEFGIKLKRLQFIGQGSSDYMDFIILKDKIASIELILKFIQIHNEKWDYCKLSNITKESSNFPIIKNILTSNGDLFKAFQIDVCPFVRLESDMNTYLKTRKPGLRYDLKRGELELAKLGSLKYIKIIDQKIAIKELASFFEMLTAREKLGNRLGTNKSYNNLLIIFQLYIENIWPKINFCKLTLDEKSIAYHFGFEDDKKIYWYKPTFDIEYLKYSPGKILIKKAMEYAIYNKFDEFDFLLGDEPYKFQWASESRESFCFFISNRKLKSKILFYWFLIIRPKLKYLKNSVRNLLNIDK